MSFATWSENYSVQVGRLDSEHKNLFAITNELYDGMKTGRGKDVMRDVVAKLAAYASRHFASEEALMRQAGYADVERHVAQHREFTATVKRFVDDVNAGAGAVSIEVLEFLKKWLTDHIQHSDKAYSGTLNAKGIR